MQSTEQGTSPPHSPRDLFQTQRLGIIGSRPAAASQDQLSPAPAHPPGTPPQPSLCPGPGVAQLAAPHVSPLAAPIPGSAVGVGQDNHHANRRTPKLILLDGIFSTLLNGKPASGVTDCKQQQRSVGQPCEAEGSEISRRGCGRR